MNIWIDIGMAATVLIALPLLVSELIRLGRLYDDWERGFIEKQIRTDESWDRIGMEEPK